MRRGLDNEIVKWGHELRMAGRLDARSSTAARQSLHEQVDGGTGDLTVNLGSTEIWTWVASVGPLSQVASSTAASRTDPGDGSS